MFNIFFTSVGISIHVPAWGTTLFRQFAPFCYVISIHVPAWGTTFSNPTTAHDKVISIHVPAWGTTDCGAAGCVCGTTISIHVPAWGTTYPASTKFSRMEHFNPRSRVGNDRAKKIIMDYYMDFNPRSRVGNDKDTPLVRIVLTKFQSTFPRGERPELALTESRFVLYFNPRSRVGNDGEFNALPVCGI